MAIKEENVASKEFVAINLQEFFWLGIQRNQTSQVSKIIEVKHKLKKYIRNSNFSE